MRTRQTIAVVLTMLTATLAATAAAVSPQQVTLRWKYNAGAEFIYRQTVTSETEVPGQGTATTENVFTVRWHVLDVADDGDATVRITTERVQMSMDGPMGTMSFDSASDQEASAPQVKVFAAMVDMSYTAVLGPAGELRSMEGMEEFRQRVRESLADDEVGAMLDAALDRSLSDDAFKSMFGQGIQGFPERQLVTGDTWNVRFEIPMGLMGSMATDVTFTLDGIETRGGAMIAVISSLGTVEIVPDENGPMAASLQFGGGPSIGTIEFDVDRGLLVRSTMSTTMETTLNLGGQEQVMGSISNVTMELVEGTP